MEGEIWDEERWEAFLKENDRQLERCMNLLFRFMSEYPPPGEARSSVHSEWENQLRAYLLSNGIRPDEVLPPDGRGPREEGFPDFADEHPGGDYEEPDDVVSSLERLPVYRASHRLASRVLTWSNSLPGHVKDSTFVQFCSHITQIPANLTKGHGIGYEIDMLGGNIACSKRALASANAALDLLRELKSVPYLDGRLYRSLYEEAFHVRNDLGVFVQDLRERFDLGVD